MHAAQDLTKASVLKLRLEIASAINSRLSTHEGFAEAVHEAISQVTTGLLNALGIPAKMSVEIAPMSEETVDYPLLRVSVNGRPCFYPRELLQRSFSYVSDEILGPAVIPQEILQRLNSLLDSQPENVDAATRQKVAEFFSSACLEIVKKYPTFLFGIEQAEAYLASLSENPDAQIESWPPAPTWLLPILHRVLELKISIAEQEIVLAALVAGITDNRTQEDIAEDLIIDLRPKVIEIHVPEQHLRELTLLGLPDEDQLFPKLRDILFFEMGQHLPAFQFVTDDNLRPGSFAFKINHLLTQPWVGLRANQYLVRETPANLKQAGIEAEAGANPSNLGEHSIITSEVQQKAEALGHIVLDRMHYLALCFAADLHANSAALLDRTLVQEQLAVFEQTAPALLSMLEARVSIDHITRVLRALLAEDISLRGLQKILEAILNYDYITATPSPHIIVDERLIFPVEPSEEWLNDAVNVASFVRIKMKRYISAKYKRDSSVLPVFMVDQDLEKLITELQLSEIEGEGKQPAHNEAHYDRILKAVRTEINKWPSSLMLPVILTYTNSVRPRLRKIVATEFPNLYVLSINEILSQTNIQPISRISFNT
jgi:hypothetical protein